MKGSSTLKTYFKQNNKVDMSVKIIAELNMNRYNSINTIPKSVYGNSLTQNYYDANFPAKSVCMPNRPTSGMHYVRTYMPGYQNKNSNIKWLDTRSWNNLDGAYTGIYDSSTNLYSLKPRCYISNPATSYRYFSSSNTSVDLPIEYVNEVWTNKIVVCFEITAGAPAFTIYTKTASTSWTSIFTGYGQQLGSTTGQISLYRSGGSWSTTQGASSISDCTKITGIRVVASGSAHPSIIEISPRIEVDLTSRLISWDMETNISESDELTPIGTVSSNSGNLVFDNTDEALNLSNINTTTCSIAEIARKWTEFRLSTYNFNNGSIAETIRQFTMFGSEWTFTDEGTVSASMFDFATILQETPNSPLVLNNVSPTQAIWRVLDAAGCPNIRIVGPYDSSDEKIIDVFYTESKTNVWDSIKQLCSSLKYSVYINEYGQVVIANNNKFYRSSDSRSSVWTFLGQNSGSNISDIISYSESISDEVNYVKINYEPIASVSRSSDPSQAFTFSELSRVVYSNRILNPSGDLTLVGQSMFKNSFTSTATSCYINPGALTSSNWGQYKGYFLADYEIIKYDGLEFQVIVSGVPRNVVVTSSDELRGLVTSIADSNSKIQFTGKLCNLERGQFNTTAAAHYVSTTDFEQYKFGPGTIRRTKYIDPNNNSSIGLIGIYGKGVGRTTCYKTFSKKYNSYFTRMSIKNSGTKVAGVVVAAKTTGTKITDGIYVHLNAVNKNKYPSASSIPAKANTGNIAMWVRLNQKDGKRYIFKATKKTFNRLTASSGHNLTVYLTKSNKTGYVRIVAKIEKTVVGKIDIKASVWNAMGTGMALWSGDNTTAYFNYAGGASSGDQRSPGENFSKALNGYRSIVKNILNNSNTKYTPDPAVVTLYKFDDLAREVVVKDVQFSKTPVLDVKIVPIKNNNIRTVKDKGIDTYIATDADLVGSMWSVSPFGATTVVANVGSRPVLTSDTGTYPLLTGRIVERYTEIFSEYEDKAAVNRLGYKKLEFSPKWVTNKLQADALARWIVDWQKNGVKTIDIESFANPLFSLLDYIDVSFTRKGVTTSQKFIINDINQSWSADSGLKTNVKLVSVK